MIDGCLTEWLCMWSKHCAEFIHDVSRKCEADNRIASLSSETFHKRFNVIAERICYARLERNVDTYCQLTEEAVKMLTAGAEESDVIQYFEKLLMKEYGK